MKCCTAVDRDPRAAREPGGEPGAVGGYSAVVKPAGKANDALLLDPDRASAALAPMPV